MDREVHLFNCLEENQKWMKMAQNVIQDQKNTITLMQEEIRMDKVTIENLGKSLEKAHNKIEELNLALLNLIWR